MPKRTISLFTPKKKYHRWYEALISRARKRQLEDYTEGHHAIPRSLGGTNEAFNIVELTFREHFICHWLLTRMTEGEARRKMLRALHWMCNGNGGQKTLKTQRGVISSWRYDVARRAAREAQIGIKRPGLHSEKFKSDLKKRMQGNSYSKGKKHSVSEETRKKLKAGWTVERRIEVSERFKGNDYGVVLKGRKRSDISAALKGRKQTPEQIAANKNSWTDERRAAVSARFKGKKRIFTEEHREKIRARMIELNRLNNPNEKRKGVPRSPEVRAKISAARKGKKQSPEHTAKTWTEEFRAQARARMIERNRSPVHIEMMRTELLGKKRSAESIAKQVATMKAKREMSGPVAHR